MHDRFVGPEASLLVAGCTAQVSYPAPEQVICSTMHSQTDAI